MEIKAIQTEYKGYLFRSRLEARWAVFFDALNEPWEYEKEGFDLGGDVGRYLPDFYLPKLDVWLEVKGKEPSEIEVERCRVLSIKTEKSVLIVAGVPKHFYIDGDDDGYCKIFCYKDTFNNHGEPFLERFVFRYINGKGMCIWVLAKDPIFNDTGCFWHKRMFSDNFIPGGYIENVNIGLSIDATKRARQKRFEYGENNELRPLVLQNPVFAY